MRVTYLKLENVAGLAVGSNKDVFEVDFKNSSNRIVAIRARNACGKTTLLSSITPFAYVTSLDERSSIPYIVPHKNGYKEIHYQEGKDKYIIKHYFKASKDTHSVKSYFMKNGKELNENGNVTSFNSLVEQHFGLTQEMMRLIRIGTNVNSFITLAPAKRKEYIGKLIEEIDLYMQIYRKVNDDIRVIKTMLQTNNANLYNCHITDVIVEEEKLKELDKSINTNESIRDDIVAKLGKIDALMKGNNLNELRAKLNEAMAAMKEYDRLKESVEKENLTNTTVEDLIKERQKLDIQKIDIQAKINSSRMMIDSLLQQIERLEVSMKKMMSNNDIQSLKVNAATIRDRLKAVPSVVMGFVPFGTSTSQMIHEMYTNLQGYNQISNMIMTFGNKPIEIYLKLRKEGVAVESWLREQSKRALSRIDNAHIESLLNKVFKDDQIITPNCDTEYQECPYYRLNEVIMDIKQKMEEEVYSDEVLSCVQIIMNNVDIILNDLDRMQKIQIPDGIRDEFTEEKILKRMEKHLPFFDLTALQNYMAILREWEIYQQDRAKLAQYENQISVYQSAGVDSTVEEIRNTNLTITKFKNDIKDLQDQMYVVDNNVNSVDSKIALLTKYNDSQKYSGMVSQTIETTQNILKPLENAETEKMELEFKLREYTNAINGARAQHRLLENKLIEYNRLVEEGKKLGKMNKDLTVILEAVSTKKGIPVFYMQTYLKKIKDLSNKLLALIYGDEFELSSFVVTPETFEVPYTKNGKRIADVKYASQSEIALSTMALSFALATNASNHYNILLLDEIDGGLDETNRSAFMKMLYMQMDTIHAEQVFIISQNLAQMSNIPMDCIDLSDTGLRSSMHNIIYEA